MSTVEFVKLPKKLQSAIKDNVDTEPYTVGFNSARRLVDRRYVVYGHTASQIYRYLNGKWVYRTY